MFNTILKIYKEKSKLLNDYVDSYKNSSEKNNKIEIIQFSENGNQLEIKQVENLKIRYDKEIGKSTTTTSFQFKFNGDNDYIIKIPHPKQTLDDIVKEVLKFELLSLYACFFSSLQPPKQFCVNKPFIIKRDGKFAIGEHYYNHNPNKSKFEEFKHFVLMVSNNTHMVSKFIGIGELFLCTDVNILNSEKEKEIFDLEFKNFINIHECVICQDLKEKINRFQVPSNTLQFMEPLETYRMGGLYFNKSDVNKAIPPSIKYFEKSAYLGNSFAYNSLGYIYNVGKGLITPDVNKAVEYYKQSAMRDNCRGYYNLGVIYHDGEGTIPKDINKAIEFYKKAAVLGDSDSMNNLGCIYDRGEDHIQQDTNLAIQYFQQSGKMGNPFSLNNLAIVYLNGNRGNVKVNTRLAISFYIKSADMNYFTSQSDLLIIFKK